MARSSERLPRDPFAEEGVDDHVAIAFAGEDVLPDQGGERGLHGGAAAQAIPGTNVRGEQLATVLQNGRPERPALRKRQLLPRYLEQRLVLAEQASEGCVQIVEVGRPSPFRAG